MVGWWSKGKGGAGRKQALPGAKESQCQLSADIINEAAAKS